MPENHPKIPYLFDPADELRRRQAAVAQHLADLNLACSVIATLQAELAEARKPQQPVGDDGTDGENNQVVDKAREALSKTLRDSP